MGFLPVWLVGILAGIGFACAVTAIGLIAAWLLVDWADERREAVEAREIRGMRLDGGRVVSWTGRAQPARWQ